MTAAVPIPARMAHLDRDPRGYAIPVTVLRDKSGRAHFTINEEDTRQRLIREDRCPICGGKLLRGRWFAGGPGSALHERGAYIDPPMHDECVHYALRVCPYLAAPNYSKRIDDKTLKPDDRTIVTLDPTMDANRPPLFVAVMAVGRPHHIGGMLAGLRFVRYVKPRKPYRKIEYWQHGRQLDPAEAAPLIAPELARLDVL